MIVLFWIFLWFLLTNECNHSFISLLTLEVFFWEIVLLPYIIIVFSLRKMAPFNCHRCQFLYFEVFLRFLPMDECNHFLASMIKLELLCWEILLSIYWYYYHWSNFKYFSEQDTNPIVFVIFIPLFFDLLYQRGYQR